MTSPSGTESIDLAPRELLVVLTNDAERRSALSQYAEMRNASAASKSRAATSPSAGPAADDTAAHRPSPPPLGYTPPKSAEQSTNRVRQTASAHGHSTSQPLASPTSAGPHPSSSKPHEKSKKPRRPHTSAGPRDSVDVRVGGAVPVPVPAPVPTNGYASSSSAGPSSGSVRSRGSSGKYSPDHDSSEGLAIAEQHGPNADAAPFQTLNTEFTGLNGIGGRGALALRLGRVSPPQPPQDDGDALLVQAEFGPGVRMDKVRQPVEGADGGGAAAPARGREDKSELIRAWEEELVRIEKASRRSSNVLAFWRRRDKPKESLKQRIAA